MAGKDRAADPPGEAARGRALSLPGAWNLARAAVLSMRPIQWTKSILVFLPLAFSVSEKWSVDEPGLAGELVLNALAGAVIFGALSGGVYIVNDIFDREKDRVHPRKRRRPIASGELPLGAAQGTAALLLGGSVVGAFLLNPGFGIVSLVFLAMNFAYSSFMKELIILDVMMVSAGYLLRVVAGALVIDVTVSPWLYTTIGLGALFIALGKRYSELGTAGDNAASQRAVLEQYSQPYLSQLITLTGDGHPGGLRPLHLHRRQRPRGPQHDADGTLRGVRPLPIPVPDPYHRRGGEPGAGDNKGQAPSGRHSAVGRHRHLRPGHKQVRPCTRT